jgi:hypothetical protein
MGTVSAEAGYQGDGDPAVELRTPLPVRQSKRPKHVRPIAMCCGGFRTFWSLNRSFWRSGKKRCRRCTRIARQGRASKRATATPKGGRLHYALSELMQPVYTPNHMALLRGNRSSSQRHGLHRRRSVGEDISAAS